MKNHVVHQDEARALSSLNIFDLTQTIIRFIKSNEIQEILIFGYCDPSIHTHFWIHNAFYNALKSIDIGIPVIHTASIPYQLSQRNVLCLFTYDNKNSFHEGVLSSKNWFYLMLNHTYDNTYPDFIKISAASRKAVVFHVWRGETTNLLSPASQWPHSFDSNAMSYSLSWAARLPPKSILNKNSRSLFTIEDRCVFIGTVWHRNIDQVNELAKWCIDNSIPLDVIGKQYEKIKVSHPTFVRVQNRTISDQEATDFILGARYAPALQGKTQLPYIPCRAFINASYGKHVLTNNWAVKKILPFSIFHEDTFQLMEASKDVLSLVDSISEEHIDYIAKNHTYLNRLSELLELFNKQ